MRTTRFNWTSAALTHVGLVRKHNEDNYMDAGNRGFWVVADGMGGHTAGDVASRYVVESLTDFEPGEDLADNVDEIEDRLIGANDKCRQRSPTQDPYRGMGSTVVALLAFGNYVFFLWAGDSRIYRLRSGRIELMTEDHSLVQEMYALGHITEDEAETHPSSNVITRAVGVGEKFFLDMEFNSVQAGDRYLLCSDGLNKDMDDNEIGIKLAAPTLEEACQNLVQGALRLGGGDNTTVIVVEAN